MKKNYLKIPFVKTKNLVLNIIVGNHDKEEKTSKNKDVEKPFWVERRHELAKDESLRRETVNLLNQAFLKALEMEEEDKDKNN